MYDIIIIGAGPAGLTASIYARRASKKVLIIERKNFGGQIINTLDIENYPTQPHISGIDFAVSLYNQSKDLGTEIIYEDVVNININNNLKEVITSKNKYISKSVIIATGSNPRKLGLENEDKLIGKGISYCSTCDGSFFKDKEVMVVGGGNTAFEDALYLSDIASKVYLVHRKNEFKADESTVNLLKKKKNVEFILNCNVTKLISNKKLQKVEIKNNNGDIKTIMVSALFIAIGRIPGNDIFSKLIHLDKDGYILSKEDCKTNIPGIFAAGDTRTKEVRQLVTATNDGAISAINAIKYINNL